MTTTTDNAAIVEGLFEAFGRGDLDHVRECMHPDVTVHGASSLPYGGDHSGIDGLFAYIGGMAAVYELAVKTYSARACGDDVVLRMELGFTSIDTGRSATSSVVEVYKLRDGKIYDIDVFYKDTKGVLDLLEA